jgi:translation initiation factor 1
VGLFDGTKWETVSQCQVCGHVVGACQCPSDLPPAKDGNDSTASDWKAAEKQTARVRTEKRKAKRVVTVVTGLSGQETDLAGLLAKLKAACGAGGSLEDENLVIQGDQAERVAGVLRQIGYRVKP